MHTITIFGLKGGTGRSMLTKALAAALVAKDRRVAIFDATGDAFRPLRTSHAAWAARCHAEDISEENLEVIAVADGRALADGLVRARKRGVEIALIDTQAQPTCHHAVAAVSADLVLMPFTGPLDAAAVGADVVDDGDQIPIFGVNTAVRGTVISPWKTAKAYGGPILRTALPQSDLFARMPEEGRLDRIVASLDEEAEGEDSPGLAEAEDLRRAWVQVQELATEVLWVLKGYRLERYGIDAGICGRNGAFGGPADCAAP